MRQGTRFNETGILDTKVYTKPTETYQYLHKTSSHPPHVFKALVYGETLCYAPNTNNKDDFLLKVNNFSEKLTTSGYKASEITTITGKVSHNERSNLIHKRPNKQKSKTPLVLSKTYNPHINHGDLNQAINKHWSMIQRNEILSGIFPDPPFIAYRKDQNIQEKLIRAKLNQSLTDSTSQQLNHTSHDSGFIDDPDDTLDILVSLLEEQFTNDQEFTPTNSQPSP